MTSELDDTAIDRLASKPGTKRVAVENFLISLDPALTRQQHLANLALDARMYTWNRTTVNAIREGIDLHHR